MKKNPRPYYFGHRYVAGGGVGSRGRVFVEGIKNFLIKNIFKK